MPDRTASAWAALRAWARRRFRFHLVAAVLAVVVSIAILTLFIFTRQQELAEGTPAPVTVPVATSTLVPTEPGTPDTDAAFSPGSLPALLGRAPDWLDVDTGLPVQATYADLAGWLDARGVDAGSVDDAAFREAIAPLALPEPLRANGVSAAWRENYGFDLRQVDAVLAVGQAPNLVLIMPGNYDVDALYATWVASGYQAVEVEETTVWSLAPGDRIDLSAPASRPALGLLNTVVVLDDGTLIASSRQSLVADALKVVDGRSRALADHEGLRAALPGSAGAVSAVLASGELLQAPASASRPGATPAAGIALPPVDLVLFTLPPPGAGEAAVTMTLVFDDPPGDPAALRRALTARVEADAVWSSRYRVDAIRSGGAGRLVRIAITGAGDRPVGLDIVDPRELSPFRWTPGD